MEFRKYNGDYDSICDFQWLLWQGFDHGENKKKFEKTEKIVPQIRRHFNSHLSMAAVNSGGKSRGRSAFYKS